jgi:hypothetical protein
MTTLVRKYTRDIRQYDWAAIVSEAQDNVTLPDDPRNPDDSLLGYCYLGSLINPSGKYYTPFACGNVHSCSQCGGSGVTKKLYPCSICHGTGTRTDQFMQGECNVCNGTGVIPHACNQCGGTGSHEAYQDQVFFEVLDRIAELNGGWIEAGEGDPTDTYFVMPIEQPEAEEDSIV